MSSAAMRWGRMMSPMRWRRRAVIVPSERIIASKNETSIRIAPKRIITAGIEARRIETKINRCARRCHIGFGFFYNDCIGIIVNVRIADKRDFFRRGCCLLIHERFMPRRIKNSAPSQHKCTETKKSNKYTLHDFFLYYRYERIRCYVSYNYL